MKSRKWVVRRDVKELLILALLLGVIVVGWWSPVLRPLRLCTVLFHELGHAAAALLTGGSVVDLALGLDEGGQTTTRGGSSFVILNGGYLGSAFAGLSLLVAAQLRRWSQFFLGSLAILMGLATLLYLRPVVSFGFGFGLGTGVGFWALAVWTPPVVRGWALRFLGLFSFAYALMDIRDDVFGGSTVATDAHQLAALTHVPAPLWGGGWLVVSAGAAYLLRRRILGGQ